MESLIFNQKKCQGIVIKTMAAIAVAGVGLMMVCSSSVAAAMMMGGEEKEDKKKTPLGPSPGPTAGPAPLTDPCTGLVDDSLASSIPVECLQKIFKDQGCTEEGTVYPGDDYDGWWRKSPQGTTKVYCGSDGTPCGAGNYADAKADIIAWSTLQSSPTRRWMW